jgi:hypothetical protein
MFQHRVEGWREKGRWGKKRRKLLQRETFPYWSAPRDKLQRDIARHCRCFHLARVTIWGRFARSAAHWSGPKKKKKRKTRESIAEFLPISYFLLTESHPHETNLQFLLQLLGRPHEKPGLISYNVTV